MPDAQTIGSMMGRASFKSLHTLCSASPKVFAAASSPSASELESFRAEFHKNDYVKGLIRFGQLKCGIRALEAGYHREIIHVRAVPPPPDLQALQNQKCNEREVRFIHRLATLLGPWDASKPELPIKEHSPPQGQTAREAATKALNKAHTALKAVLRDEFFRESLAPLCRHDTLRKMQDDLPKAAKWIEEAAPAYPYQRRRQDNRADTRVLVNRLADTCYRIYGDCNEMIIEYLTSYDGLGFVAEHEDIRGIIQEALDRKKNQFQRRIPREDYNNPGLRALGSLPAPNGRRRQRWTLPGGRPEPRAPPKLTHRYTAVGTVRSVGGRTGSGREESPGCRGRRGTIRVRWCHRSG